MEILSGEQMRNVDRRAIDELGIPGLELMEAAGRGVAEAVLADYPGVLAGRVLVLCGKGNNGGDGLVVARYLRERRIDVRVVLLARSSEVKGDARANLQSARKAGVEIHEAGTATAWKKRLPWLAEATLVVDAMLGTGVVGGARGVAARVIEDLNASGRPVAAIDLPSGIDADRSAVEGSAVRAERTYTLCRPKLALAFDPAAAFAGRWSVVPIGIPDAAVEAEQPRLEWLDRSLAASLLPARAATDHKGRLGHLLAVAGGTGKAGAAVLVARGALRSGVGLLTVATPSPVRGEVAVQQCEMMTEALPANRKGGLARAGAAVALELLRARDALALGPGLGTAPGTRAAVLELTRRRGAPAVLDADALNAFSHDDRARIGKLRAGKRPLVLTPHPGEASRLLGWSTGRVQADRLAAARKLARKTGAVTVLKGHRSLVADPGGRVAINSSGNPGMASGGSGDVLTGMIGAFLARGLAAWDAARLAVWAHGDAGDRAAKEKGQDGLIATDVVEEIPAALLALRTPEKLP